jgi:phosphate/sulfate permease
LLLLAGALAFVFGWNNGSFLVGNMRGAGNFSLRFTALVSGAGLVAGTLAEGPKMKTSLVGTLAPTSTYLVIVSALATTILFLFVLSGAGRPMALSMTMVGAFLGATYGGGIAISGEWTATVIGFWFVAPIMTGLLTYGIYAIVRRAVSELSLITIDWMNRVVTVVSAFFVSYTLGANNIGLLQSSLIAGSSGTQSDVFTLPTVGVALALLAVVGMAVFGGGTVSGTIGDKMFTLSPQGVVTLFVSSSIVVWVGTQFALPISVAQCVLGGMFGASIARSLSIMNRKLVYETILSWVVVPLSAFIAAMLFVML